jgi:hypothetical protein
MSRSRQHHLAAAGYYTYSISVDETVLSARYICKVLRRMLLDSTEKTKIINQCKERIIATEAENSKIKK